MLMIGCRDEFQVVLPTEPGLKYNLIAALSPSDLVTVRLSENISIGQRLTDIDYKDAEITFSGPDVPGGELPMVWNEVSERYHLVREDFRVSEGLQYTIMAVIGNEFKDTIIASTEIPKAVGFSTRFISAEKIPIDDILSHHVIELELSINQPEKRPIFYRFVPYRLESVIRINNGGIDVIDFGTRSLMEVISVETGANAVEKFVHVDGIYIDESRLNRTKMRIVLRTIEPLRDGESVLEQDGKDLINRLHLELFTVSPSIYAYDKFVDRVNTGPGAGVPSPQVMNIQNASGVFGGSSRTITFLEVK